MLPRLSLGLVGALVALGVAVAAQGGPNPGAACQVAGEASTGAWTLDATHDARQFRFVLRSGDDPTRRASGAFDLGSAAFSHEAVNGTGANASSAGTTLTIYALHEYHDRDGDERFGPGDENVRTYRVASLPQPTLQVLGRVDGGFDAVAVYPINASGTSDGLPVGQTPPLPGQLRVSFLVLEHGALVDGNWVPPTRVPITVQVAGFPFVANVSRLAVEVRVGGEGALQRLADGFVHPDDVARSEQRWGPCGAVDGSDHTNELLVLQDAAATAATASAVFNYPRADDVQQTFAVSAAWKAASPGPTPIPLVPFLGDAGMFAAAVVLSALIVAATVVRRIRNP